MKPKFKYNDGGRSQAGFQGHTGDCVTRAIAIATELPYEKVYNDLFELAKQHRDTKRDKLAKAFQSGKQNVSPRTGVHKTIYNAYMKSLGWDWIPAMAIGQGCKVHLRKNELPAGKIVARVTKHMVAVIDGVINDTYDCSRNGTRCVYGYFVKR